VEDLIGLFERYTRGLPSCGLYREWCGITLVAGALERRVWAVTYGIQTWPNLFVMLVGPPGAGKKTIHTVRDLWRKTRSPAGERVFHVGRKSYSKASLMDDMAEARKVFIPPSGSDPQIYHCLLIAAEEFGSLFPIFDNELLAALTDLWNADEVYDERRRASDIKSLSIEFPLATGLFGYQPAMMAQTMPATAWDQGFMRRTVMIWNDKPDLKSLFDSPYLDQDLESKILDRMWGLSNLWGFMKWEAPAAAKIDTWHLASEGDQSPYGPPRPAHVRLISYNNTRSHLAIKLAMVASASESDDLVIRVRHVERAFDWLHRTEARMPDVFRAMTGDSDDALITEMHNWMVGVYAKQRPKPIHGSLLYTFLKARIPVHKISTIIQVMERSAMIARDEGTDFWRPLVGSRPSAHPGPVPRPSIASESAPSPLRPVAGSSKP